MLPALHEKADVERRRTDRFGRLVAEQCGSELVIEERGQRERRPWRVSEPKALKTSSAKKR